MSVNQPYITIITPCYNENTTVIRFLKQLEGVLNSLPYSFRVVVVNDCSSDDTAALLEAFSFKAQNICLDTIDLPANAGHQKAIYEGLVYAQALENDHFIIMDADGEDSPAAIPVLLQHRDADIVHVVRGKRSESIFFRSCYGAYKAMFKVLTGRQMNYGNFCLINRGILECAVHSSFIHFAAFLSKQNGNVKYIVAAREKRIGGQSKMGFAGLMAHAFNSFTETGYHIQAPGLLFLKRSFRNR